MDNKDIILEGKNLTKDFNGNVVLKDVSIVCKSGEAIAISGENGAGKSTLMNIISGGLKASSGEVYIDGKLVNLKSSQDAKKMGIAFVHQELSLMQDMTVGENILLGNEPKKGLIIDQKKLHKDAENILRDIGFNIDVNILVKDLSPAEKQMTEIAKAWSIKPRIIIFDEPTSSLNKEEADILFAFINRTKTDGVCSILISHRMEDIFACCDRVIVLKDGCFVYESSTESTTIDEIVSQMVGREFNTVYPKINDKLSDKIKLELKNISMGSKLKDISIKVPEGAVIGIGGLEGQGQRELARGLFGIEPFSGGEYYINGKKVKINSPVIAKKNGIAFVSDDRKGEGLFLQLESGENITSLVLDKYQKFGIVDNSSIEKEIKSGVEKLNIKISSHHQIVGSLSGGNQQKIVFSKWLKTNPDILILDEPTRGIDVQSKLEIYQLIRNLTRKGVSVIIFTSDMMELIGMSDNIYILYEGRVTGEIFNKDATEENIMRFSTNTNKKEEVK